ncbi:hypothetical protein DRW48_03560 [Paracoccus suum]|uniref:Uncharacterized protein n=1 Tax=Paracoccus suum TaxID=2259340 RepID=A0A344PHN9_9RHOB|nr:hypothetical protein [Paracoccus suum]AXC48894.1 hypothetical protein DRW48_03560 [Paracoccus suum]
MKAAPALTLAAAALASAFVAVPAQSSVELRDRLETQPRAWSAIAGQDAASVMAMASALASGADASVDAPYCDSNPMIAHTLSHDFGESLVDDAKVNKADTQLWGSDVMGTWTLVMARPDKTSCVIASGVGYSDTTNPDVFYHKAGLRS